MSARWPMFAAGLAAVGRVLAMSAAEAQDGGSGTIGIGAAIVPEFDGSDEGQLIPLIIGRYGWRGGSIALEQTTVKLDLLGDGDFLSSDSRFEATAGAPLDAVDPRAAPPL